LNMTKKSLGISIALFLGILSVPFFTWAQVNSSSTSPGLKKALTYCQWVDSYSTEIDGVLNDQIARLEGDYSKETQFLAANRKDADKKEDDYFFSRDTALAAYLIDLAKLAETESQKKSLMSFDQAVRSAMEARRKAQEIAVLTYRQTVDAARAKKLEDTRQVLRDYQNSLKTIFAEAKLDCEDGKASLLAKRTVQDKLGQAKEGAKSRLESVKMLQTEMSQALIKRNLEFKNSNETFNQTIASARDELKKALKTQVDLEEFLDAN